MPRKKKIRSITVLARLWTDTNGNTYHSCRILVNGRTVGFVPMTYGYGNQFEHSTFQWLVKTNHIPVADSKIYCYGSLWQYCENYNIAYETEQTHVRKRDLYK